ncbi:MAG: UDP-N-acetylglucosamine diphosphorylase/glucosamine-1-phosphate N-acetyltransferase [Elusimicrobia bacterium RIFOXYA2_FULL_50_26]|nr:MAG: UDP-N-acetylglucosamine diphosphorylase/glucosamine-1-phosphate N-acetyltransferase [Elusimicrobia bacterium RIFOXYA2_FULL_50_26]
MNNKLAVVILAAGEGTRMKSAMPKVLHSLLGRPLLRWVLSSVDTLKPARVCVVIGHRAEEVRQALKDDAITFVEQKQQFGSGHALAQAAGALKNFQGDILVLCGDTPLISGATLKNLYAHHRKCKNSATILSAGMSNPFGYGRICRAGSGMVAGIVEEKDADDSQKKITEINSGIYCFSSPLIWSVLKKIRPDNKKKEYYLTDAIEILNAQGCRTDACCIPSVDETLGVNTRLDLAGAENVARQRALEKLMLSGVTVINPATVSVSFDAKIGRDTVIYPDTIIEGATVIGEGCAIGPGSFIRNSVIGDSVEVRSSYIYDSIVAAGAKIGPFSHLRPGTKLGEAVKVGNFSEVKKSVIGAGSKINHLSYVGDSKIGKGVNIGAGTITCNYDGFHKNETVIDDRVFVGSNVNLVAPVRVGRDAILGAGSTITDDVPPRMLAIARARQVNKTRKKI